MIRFWIGRLRCALHWHDDAIDVGLVEPRIFVRCVRCGWESPGWVCGPAVRT